MGNTLKRLRAAVIGGANTDIWGAPSGALALHESNIGAVTQRPGGVGRNIAHRLTLLGAEVSLVTALGDDAAGSLLRESCAAAGIGMEMTAVFPGERSSTYLYISDESGDLLAAVNDMGITARITPALLEPLMNRLNGFDAVVTEANLPEETLAYLAGAVTAPLYADAVSAAKCRRLLPLLPKLEALKVNLAEAQTLTGEADREKAAAALVSMGVKRVFLSMGADGVLAADGEGSILVPAERIRAVNTNGAGDAAAAAMIFACASGMSLAESARLAVRAGTLAAMSPDPTGKELFRELVP